MSKIENIWFEHSKLVNITRYSKAWWNEDCYYSLDKYYQTCSLENWKNFKSTVKKSKCSFFDDKIEEIANKKYSSWELINWVKKRKLFVIEAIQYERCPYIELEDLWNALYNSLNSTQAREIDLYILDKIPNKTTSMWNLFSKKELIDAIEKCNNLSAPGSDKLIWRHIKSIIRSKECICKLINITNIYI